jgi:mitochondrial fission protein ELM1
MNGRHDAPVWILHDGKVGLRNQVMGVAEAVGLPFAEKRLEVRLPWKILPPALWFNAVHAPGPGGDRLVPPWPILVIAAGGRASAPALAIRRRAGGRCLVVQIQDPRIAPKHFDLMLVPEHDSPRGPNVIVTHGAVHRVTGAKLAAAARIWAENFDHLPRPRAAVLLGGSNGVYRLEPETMGAIAAQLAALARSGVGLMVTPSRRTGPAAETILREALAGLPAVIWDGAGENPYFGMLGLADHVIATADSISMITEASATGKPVHVIPLPGGSQKFDRFHDSMRASGIVRPFTGALEDWTYPARNDTEAAGARIRAMLTERGLISRAHGDPA